MRKFGAFGLAAFYLLLTTGMFVCLVHCSAEYLFGKTTTEVIAHQDDDHDHETLPAAGKHQAHEKGKDHKKSCGEGKDCSCCNKHDNYVIKENSSAAPELQLSTMQVAAFPAAYQSGLALQIGIYQEKVSWLNATGPPRSKSQSLFIKYRSLLI